MRKIRLTRRLKITTGIIVIVLTAVLVMGFGTGLPGIGQKFMGAATRYSDHVELYSDWLGAATGVITVTNPCQVEMLVRGYKHIGGDYRLQGEDILDPGETRSYDYKGICKVQFYELSFSAGFIHIDLREKGDCREGGCYFNLIFNFSPDYWTERGSGGGAGNELNLR
jgi:hypothetical protein